MGSIITWNKTKCLLYSCSDEIPDDTIITLLQRSVFCTPRIHAEMETGYIPLLLWTLPLGIFFIENKRKRKPKELPKHLIPCLLVNKLYISAEQVEILVTALSFYFPVPLIPLLSWNGFKVNHGGTYHLYQQLPCMTLPLEYMICYYLYYVITKVATKCPFEYLTNHFP